ncbi:hypothetical protein [Streptomyces purpureus]|uniref:hypothetical protein n=1 Tax=Streptomyces purpureus TaxID=1951 RepID=UPI0003749E4B|nr:hypothetical protein [Streptomyces purpureus]
MAAAVRAARAEPGRFDGAAHVAGIGGGEGAPGDLKHSDEPWTKAAGVAESLLTSMTTAKHRLTAAHEGVTPGNEGLASVGVLKSVLTSWEERIGAVKDECGSLAPNLRLVARDQGEREIRVKASFSGVGGSSSATKEK